MTLDYEDMVRSLTHAYLEKVMRDDEPARQIVREMAESFGFDGVAGDNIVNQFVIGPLKEWHDQGSAA